MALEGCYEGECSPANIDDSDCQVGRNVEELLLVPAEVEVEEEDGGLCGHQCWVKENDGHVLGHQHWRIPGSRDVHIMEAQALGGAEVDGEGSAKGEDLVGDASDPFVVRVSVMGTVLEVHSPMLAEYSGCPSPDSLR